MIKDYEREQFIKLLASSTPAEMKDFIDNKGKPRKMVCPVVFHHRSQQVNN